VSESIGSLLGVFLPRHSAVIQTRIPQPPIAIAAASGCASKSIGKEFQIQEDVVMRRGFRFRELTLLVLVTLILWIVPTTLLADFGKIAGTIRDARTNEPLPDVNVEVVGGDVHTGGSTDLDGLYTVLAVPAGSYTVTISCVGFATVIQHDVIVSSGLTTRIDMSLEQAVVQGQEVVITWQKPLVQLGVTQSETTIGETRLKEAPAQNVGDVIKTLPGVHQDSEGEFHFRGGRSSENLTIVDGISNRDPLVGGGQNDLNFDAVDIKEVQVLTGGFNAEYGNAQSAIINVTTREGDVNNYTGSLEWNSDRLINETSFDQDIGRWTFGGPVPYSKSLLGNKMTFFWSGSGNVSNTYAPYNITRSANDYLGLGFDVPERQSNEFQTRLKLAYRLDERRKFTLSIGRRYRMWDIFPDGEAAVSGNYGWQYFMVPEHRPYAINERSDWSLSFSHQVSKKTFYELRAGNFKTSTKVLPRGRLPNQFTLRDSIEDHSVFVYGANDLNGNSFFDGYVDANRNGKYDGGGEGYEDLNQNGQWDRGEDWIDLNGDGVYNYAEPWTDRTNPVTGENNVGVWDPWDPFTDLNHNGVWDDAEPQLPEQDWNHNGHWDGERFQDANHDGQYEGWGEGYDDYNGNGAMDPQMLFTDAEDTPEPFVDGDLAWDTGEPFTDLPDPETGFYNGVWDDGEPWVDLPTTAGLSAFSPNLLPTLNNQYDGPNGVFDEYELFTKPAGLAYGMDPREPVIYNYDPLKNGTDWLYLGRDSQGIPLYRYRSHTQGKATWTNRTIDDQADPVFDWPNGMWDQGKESFSDYNNNGVCDYRKADGFLNAGQWDSQALYQERSANEYTLAFDITSQLNQYHEFQAGLEMKYRDLTMQQLEDPDLLYNNPDVPLPAGSPFPDRGDIRDFYDHRPWEGSMYVQDKMEFEGLIVNAGLRWDFVFHDPWLIEQSQQQVDAQQPGALLARRGTYKISPRLGISHPISETSKLYFNYGHFYQAPDFQYFYRSATASITSASVVGNPNLEYEKTVQYELGVNTQVTNDWVIDLAGYYRDIYNLISTVPERFGPITIDRYFNLDYGRVRGVEITLEKQYSKYWSMSWNYDFSYAFGKASSASAGIVARLDNVPVNTDEHPLDWDETHKISSWITFQVPPARDPHDRPRWFGIWWPTDWLLTLQWQFGSGRPYTPSTYSTGLSSNLIPSNSARMPWTETTDLRFEKYFRVKYGKDAKDQDRAMRITLGMDINNLFNKHNVLAVYGATGNAYDSTHPDDPADTDGTLGSAYDHNPRNYGPPRQILFRVGMSF
jgi:outer membrane receptor protein involved in Fe transport